MIKAADLTLVGKVNKTHGIAGELSVSFIYGDLVDAVSAGACLIMDVDGIFTPFFVGGVRPRGNGSLLICIDGVHTQQQAAFFVGRQVYMATDALPDLDDDEADGEDGMYAGQLIGFSAIDGSDNKTIGEIVDIDEQTQNVLFIIETPEGETVYIPVADEFIQELSADEKKIVFDLPEGLL